MEQPAPGTPDSYQPRDFWNRRLSEHFDLRGTGETGLSLAYNRACYRLRREVLARALREQGFDPSGRTVLDVGCGAGFFTRWYLEHGARVTGVDIAPTSVERLRQRHPQARFVLSDVSEVALDARYDLVNAFDVLYHIVDDTRWERALVNLANATGPGGLLLVTDAFPAHERTSEAAHNRMRSLARYEQVLTARGLERVALKPTHVLLNRDLGPFRSLNRIPGVLLALDHLLLAAGAGRGGYTNKLLLLRRTRAGTPPARD
jgi:2-polyprenyl-3-methyl-5-hydroxy-6-metoxy-1,4-benzoquinol methylase